MGNLQHLFIFYLFITLFMETIQVGNNDNTKGRAFMISFLKIDGGNSQNGVIVTTEFQTVIFVNVPSTLATTTRHLLQANSSIHLQLPYETSVTSWGIPERKAVTLYSMEPVSVYGISSSKTSGGGFLAIPVDKWSDHYIVATYDGYQKNGGEIVIISAENNTSISVWLNVDKSTRCVAEYRTVDRSTLLSFIMNNEDVLRIACDDDLTGSVIKGSKPIGVISGNTCVKIPKAFAFCDHVIEMMIPTTSLGQDYIIAPLAGRKTHFRVIYADSSEGQTNVTVSNLGPDLTVSKANHLFKEFIIPSGAVVRLNSSKPVLVVLYSTGSNNTQEVGDPSMAIVVPIERYDSEYNIDFSWGNLIDISFVNFNLNIFSSGNVIKHTKSKFDQFTSVKAYGFVLFHASVTSGSFVSKNSFFPGSNIIVSASSQGSSAAFPVGMKLNFFTGVDNCTDSPCHHGICYTHGNRLMCYCGDQLAGDRCQEDTFNACASSPCQNNSTCTDLPFSFKCTCLENFTGELCESVMKDKPESKKKVVRKMEMCTCICENVTSEMTESNKEQIKKELSVNVKETNKNKNRYRAVYDARPSATSIGIVGILFIVLVFGYIILLDMITAVCYVMSCFTELRNVHKRRDDERKVNTSCTTSTSNSVYRLHEMSENVLLENHEFHANSNNTWTKTLAPIAAPISCSDQLILQDELKSNASKLLTVTSNPEAHIPTIQSTDQLQETPCPCSTQSHNTFYMPRFRINSKKILSVGENGEAFKMEKCLWGLRKVLLMHSQDSLDFVSPEKANVENKSDSEFDG